MDGVDECYSLSWVPKGYLSNFYTASHDTSVFWIQNSFHILALSYVYHTGQERIS